MVDEKYAVTKTRLEQAMVPKLFWSHKLCGFSTNVRPHLAEVLDNLPVLFTENRGVLLGGKFCTGKTSFACMVLRRALELGKRSFFFRVGDLSFGWSVNQGAREKLHKAVSFVRDYDVVVLDDLGIEEEVRATNRLFYYLRGRYESGKFTVITTNLSANDLQKRYGAAAFSVITRSCPVWLELRDVFVRG
jgi:DNA replication protein DnaC